MSRPARLLSWLERRLGSGLLAVVLAVPLPAAGVGVGVAASHEDGERAPSSAAPPVADGAPGASAVALKLVSGHWPRRGGAAYYRRVTRRQVPPKGAAGFLPLYREAERVYHVNWLLIASVHRQETAFSKAPSTYRGLNDFGCCAGPMQFNVTNGPVSTWKRYRKAYRDGRRPATYPHRTKSHPSIYDDFDAIMAAGKLLSASGAGPSLDAGAWQAAYSYYGHDLYGITYASEVLARAIAWERDGFCPNCNPDPGLVARLEEDYGTAARIELVGTESSHKAEKRRGGDRKSKRRKAAARPRTAASAARLPRSAAAPGAARPLLKGGARPGPSPRRGARSVEGRPRRSRHRLHPRRARPRRRHPRRRPHHRSVRPSGSSSAAADPRLAAAAVASAVVDWRRSIRVLPLQTAEIGSPPSPIRALATAVAVGGWR